MANRYTYLLICALSLAVCTATAADNAQRIIAELNLEESSQPIREHSLWQPPEKVAVYVPGSMADRSESILAQARSAAGSATVFPLSFEDLDALKDADVILGFCSLQSLEAAPKLRWLHSYSVGVDRCTLDERIDEYEFVMTNNQRLSAPDIAEHFLGLLFGLTRNLDSYMANQQKSQWDREGQPAINVANRTLLVLGLGGIGTEIARRADALGMRVLATRNSSRTGPDFVEYVGLSNETEKLAGEADFIVNALPLTDTTQGLVDKKLFASAKRGALYFSVGRGATTVTEDLMAALESGQIGGAGLDVTDPEPLPEDHPLWSMPNVIITPHVAAYTDESFGRTLAIAMENLRRYAEGEPLLSVVSFEKGY